MVRKVMICFAIMVLCCGFATTAHAQSYNAYDGTMGSTYLTYFRDIANGLNLKDNYVALRSGQYEYIMAVGDLKYTDGNFVGVGDVKVYRVSSDSNYNATYSYSVSIDTNFTASVGDEIIYSDLGDFPQLVERGSKYEIISAVFIGIALLSSVIRRIFC